MFIANQQFEYHDADGPNVDFVVVLFLDQQLRRHIERRATSIFLAFDLIEESRESEIGDLDVGVIGVLRSHQDICWLHISMHYTLLVHVIQSKEDLPHNS